MATLDERRATYGVDRRPDGDYTTTVFICPTNGRQYEPAQHPRPINYGTAVAVGCYWCDSQLHVRGQDRDFDRDHPQIHTYPVNGGV